MLGYIIEKVTGHPYEKVVRDFIFRPVGMDHSGFDFADLKDPFKATGYLTLDDSSKRVAPIVDSTVSFAAGAIYSTVNDLYKWDRAIYGNKLLQPASWKQAFTPFKQKYGYGWGIDSLDGKMVVGHGGGIHGFNSNIFRVPDEQIVVIMLSNRNTSLLDQFTERIVDTILGKKAVAPKERKVDKAVLETYVGEYAVTPGLKITIRLAGDSLMAQLTGQLEYPLYAQNESSFFYKVVDAQVEFFKNDIGRIDHLILYQAGKKIPAQKIR